jgi:hypothetical protein
MKRTVVSVAVSLIVITFLPITLVGLLLPVNDYRDMAIGDIPDCDGPLAIMLLIAPSLVVYAAGGAYYAVLLRRRGRSAWAVALMIICVVMLTAAGGKGWAAYAERSRPEHRNTCGEGW